MFAGRLLSLFTAGLIGATVGSLLLSSDTSAVMISDREFNNFCNQYPAGVNDFMYVDGDSGGVVTVVVTDPDATSVPITVAMEVNYCIDWGNHSKYNSGRPWTKAYHRDKRVKSTHMVLRDISGTDRLWGISSTPQHTYTAYNGAARRTHVDRYPARLNIRGLSEGNHQIRSNFRTNIYNNSINYDPIIIPSDDYSFTVRIVHDFPDYNLTPQITDSLPTAVEMQSEHDVNSTVSNTGSTNSRRPTEWQLVRVRTDPGVDAPNPSGGLSAASIDPCRYRGESRPGVTCDVLDDGSRDFPVNTTSMPTYGASVGDVDVGTKICYGLSVRPYAHDSESWRHSSLRCILIVKKPKIQIWGNDAIAGSGYNIGEGRISSIEGSSLLGSGGRYYGSWGEYGVIATGSVRGLASGSGFARGSGSGLQSSWSNLTFANNGPYGGFTSGDQLGLLPDVIGRVENFDFDTVIDATSDRLNLSEWPSGADTVLVRNIGGTVAIAGDITRPSGYSSLADMPQMIILADRIIVDEDVETVDAWLVAQGENGLVQTCNRNAPELTDSVCDRQLTVNGPIIANELLLYRTYGSDASTSIDAPAEIMNLPADTFMWVYHQAQLNGSLRTVHTSELPPRY